MKVMGICSICGKPAMNTCMLCGKTVCNDHFNAREGVCISCKKLGAQVR